MKKKEKKEVTVICYFHPEVYRIDKRLKDEFNFDLSALEAVEGKDLIAYARSQGYKYDDKYTRLFLIDDGTTYEEEIEEDEEDYE